MGGYSDRCPLFFCGVEFNSLTFFRLKNTSTVSLSENTATLSFEETTSSTFQPKNEEFKQPNSKFQPKNLKSKEPNSTVQPKNVKLALNFTPKLPC